MKKVLLYTPPPPSPLEHPAHPAPHSPKDSSSRAPHPSCPAQHHTHSPYGLRHDDDHVTEEHHPMQHLARPKKELCDCGRAGDEWQSMGRKIGGYAHEDRGGRADGAGEGGRRRRCWRGRARLCRTWVDGQGAVNENGSCRGFVGREVLERGTAERIMSMRAQEHSRGKRHGRADVVCFSAAKVSTE